MIPLTTMTANNSDANSKADANPWMGALYAAIFTAVIAFITVFTLQAEMPFLYIPAFILIGVGPVLGYQMAMGQLAKDWKALLGGLLGFIIPVVSIILWPILVGVLDRTQSIGRLLLGSILGTILAAVAFFALASFIGQNPSWIGTGFAVSMAVWGATVGWFATNA